MTDSRLDRYREVYLAMVKHAGYRPAAPSDGFGGITLSEEQMRDSTVIEAEAQRYAADFVRSIRANIISTSPRCSRLEPSATLG